MCACTRRGGSVNLVKALLGVDLEPKFVGWGGTHLGMWEQRPDLGWRHGKARNFFITRVGLMGWKT